jgi:hypothetical protein
VLAASRPPCPGCFSLHKEAPLWGLVGGFMHNLSVCCLLPCTFEHTMPGHKEAPLWEQVGGGRGVS